MPSKVVCNLFNFPCNESTYFSFITSSVPLAFSEPALYCLYKSARFINASKRVSWNLPASVWPTAAFCVESIESQTFIKSSMILPTPRIFPSPSKTCTPILSSVEVTFPKSTPSSRVLPIDRSEKRA